MDSLLERWRFYFWVLAAEFANWLYTLYERHR